MNGISSDAESTSGSDGDDTDGDDPQSNTVEAADDSLSDGEAAGYDNSVPVTWMTHSPVSRERFTFTSDMCVKAILENPQNPYKMILLNM